MENFEEEVQVLDSSWDDFYGSSSDLVPTLLSIFDSMIANHPLDNGMSLNTGDKAMDEDNTNSHPVFNKYTTRRLVTAERQFPVLKIVEPGDELDAHHSGSAVHSKGIHSTRRSVSFRSGDNGSNVSEQNMNHKRRLLCDDRPKSTSSTVTSCSNSTTSSSSACSSASNCSLTSLALINSVNGSQLTCLASAESLADSALALDPGSELNDRSTDTWNPSRGQIRSKTDHLRNSGDSGDSGVSSPGPSSDASLSSQKNSDLSYMDRVVMEVIESEAIYVGDLQQVVEGYLLHWEEEGETAPLSREQSENLFGNVQNIYQFNSQFLKELRLCGLDPVEVARCFVRNNSGFTIYTDYCTNYPRTVSVLTELMRNEAASRACRERQTQLQHTLPLGSYLLKPVQRILKYHLLLQNIVKHCDRNTDGYTDIIVALSAMTGIAHHINDMKRKHEHAVRVQEVQSLLDGWQGEDLTTYGELVAEGAFRMYGAKAPRHVFLLDKMLLICKRKEDGTLGYKAHIMCSNLMLIESVPGEPLSFHVIPFDNPRQQYTLEARNLEQKREWTLQLKRVILENYDAVIPHHARQLVLQLGQERCERQTTLERSATKRQHSAPEYLERRKNSAAGLKNRIRKSRRSDASSPRESPLLPRRLRRSFDNSSRERSASRDRDACTADSFPECTNTGSSCPSSVEKTKERKFGTWRRCSEPSRKSEMYRENVSVSDISDDLTTSWSVTESRTDDDEERTLNVDVCTTHADEDLHSKTSVSSRCPESLEHIVEQLVMQNVEIQRILKRKKRRGNRAHLTTRNGNSEMLPSDDGIYESLVMAQPTLSDTEGEYVTIRSEEPPVPSDHSDTEIPFTRCSMRRSLGSLQNKITSVKGVNPQHADSTRTTVGRSLSCPARQAVRIAKKPEAETVTSRIQKLIHSLGSSDNWPNWIRSLSPHQRQPRCSMEKLEIAVNSDPKSDTTSPCVPSVWLRMQSEHLADPNKKSGSLPRSFQVNMESKSRWPDRPVTIASDRPASIDLQTENIDFFLRSRSNQPSSQPSIFSSSTADSQSTNVGLDDSLMDIPSTPRVSTDNIHVHPEYKIYRRSMSKSSLRTVFSTVSAKLSHFKSGSEFWGSIFNLNNEEVNRSGHNKLVQYLTRQYSTLLKQRMRNLGLAHNTTNMPVGSSTVGARIANADHSDYAIPKYCRNNTSSYSTSRSDLSQSTTSLASKTTWYGTLDSNDPTVLLMDSDSQSESDREENNSIDGFYERSFEAVEHLLDSEWCYRDSAVFSDRDDISLSAVQTDNDLSHLDQINRKQPPPVPAKPDRLRQWSSQNRSRGLAILDRMKSLEENTRFSKHSVSSSTSLENLKTIVQRRRELNQAVTMVSKLGDESETSSQHSTSTINTVVEVQPVHKEDFDSISVQKHNSFISYDPLTASVTFSSSKRTEVFRGRWNDSNHLDHNLSREAKCSTNTETDHLPANGLPKGWVKHVIGKLQGEIK